VPRRKSIVDKFMDGEEAILLKVRSRYATIISRPPLSGERVYSVAGSTTQL
jgi:hypothetical protein